MAGSFQIAVKKFTDQTEKRINATVRWLCLEISRRVILKTPVDTGRARGSWTPAMNAMATGGGQIDKSGGATLGAVSGVVAGYKPGDTFYLMSNLPYIGVLEYGQYPDPPARGSWVKKAGKKGSWVVKSSGGFSKQAPAGMVRITLAEFPGIVEQAVSHAKE
jgi:hypothetical protein